VELKLWATQLTPIEKFAKKGNHGWMKTERRMYARVLGRDRRENAKRNTTKEIGKVWKIPQVVARGFGAGGVVFVEGFIEKKRKGVP
jgi:hypothetical protein